MESDKYLSLIQQELTRLPDYVNEYYLGTNHAVTTTYQYLTEIRRFFDWLRISGISEAKSIPKSKLMNLLSYGEMTLCCTLIILAIPLMHKVI